MERWAPWCGAVAADALLAPSGPVWARAADYPQVTWKPGTVSSGSYAWHAAFWIYPANNSAINNHHYGCECKSMRCRRGAVPLHGHVQLLSRSDPGYAGVHHLSLRRRGTRRSAT